MSHGARLRGTNLSNCEMKDADIRKADFSQSYIHGLKLDDLDDHYINQEFLQAILKLPSKINLSNISDLQFRNSTEQELEEMMRSSPPKFRYDNEKMAEMISKLDQRGAKYV